MKFYDSTAREVGKAALNGLEDRRLGDGLQDIRKNDPALWDEILIETGNAALTAYYRKMSEEDLEE